jgi:hypothetical protein
LARPGSGTPINGTDAGYVFSGATGGPIPIPRRSGPPPEVLTSGIRAVSEATPLWHAVQAMQNVWLGLDAWVSWLVFCVIAMVSAAMSLRFFRWEWAATPTDVSTSPSR